MPGAGLVKHDVSNLNAESREPERAGSALPAPRRASLPILRDGTRPRRRHGSLIGARRVGAALGCLRARPTGRASALHAGASDVLAGLAGTKSARGARRCGVLFWASMWPPLRSHTLLYTLLYTLFAFPQKCFLASPVRVQTDDVPPPIILEACSEATSFFRFFSRLCFPHRTCATTFSPSCGSKKHAPRSPQFHLAPRSVPAGL